MQNSFFYSITIMSLWVINIGAVGNQDTFKNNIASELIYAGDKKSIEKINSFISGKSYGGRLDVTSKIFTKPIILEKTKEYSVSQEIQDQLDKVNKKNKLNIITRAWHYGDQNRINYQRIPPQEFKKMLEKDWHYLFLTTKIKQLQYAFDQFYDYHQDTFEQDIRNYIKPAAFLAFFFCAFALQRSPLIIIPIISTILFLRASQNSISAQYCIKKWNRYWGAELTQDKKEREWEEVFEYFADKLRKEYA